MHYPPCNATWPDDPCTGPLCNRPVASVEDVRARVEAIRSVADNDEIAHGLEDNLRELVLEAVVNDEIPREELHRMAEAALSTGEISFSRWYA